MVVAGNRQLFHWRKHGQLHRPAIAPRSDLLGDPWSRGIGQYSPPQWLRPCWAVLTNTAAKTFQRQNGLNDGFVRLCVVACGRGLSLFYYLTDVLYYRKWAFFFLLLLPSIWHKPFFQLFIRHHVYFRRYHRVAPRKLGTICACIAYISVV